MARMIDPVSAQLGSARVQVDAAGGVADTGQVTRAWRITPHGPATTRLARRGGRRWVRSAGFACDWLLHELVGADEPCELLALSATCRTDVDDTGDHVELTASFRYADAGFDVRYRVRAYPDAPGLWTQLALRPTRQFAADQLPSFVGAARSERLAVAARSARLLAAGYYNDTQHRNYDHTPILRTRSWPAGRRDAVTVDWANLVAL